MHDYSFIPLSEAALLIQFGNEINLALHEQVMSAKQFIEANPFEGFTETVPAYNSLAVFYNPLKIEKKAQTIAATVEKEIRKILAAEKSTFKQPNNQTPIIIPVCYNEAFGIDLEELSSTLHLNIEEIIQLHYSKTYKVFMTGFTPGFPYMGIVDEKLISSRKAQPRVKVEAGSVAVAGAQTGIYPLATPGGWNIIGRTPLKIFDKERTNPFLLKAGDEVKFVAITKEEFYQTPPVVANPGGG
jgi:inhibitor of KinA